MPASTRSRADTATARGKKNARPARKNTRSQADSRAQKGAGTPAGKSLDHAQHALDRAAKTEKQLRTSLKKHGKKVRAVRDDLDRREQDLKTMKSQLKTAKKSRKQATKALHV